MMILAEVTQKDIIIGAAALVSGIVLAVVLIKVIAKTKRSNLKQELQSKLEAAKIEADNILKSAQIEAAGDTIKKKEKFTAELNQSLSQLREKESRLSKKEGLLDRDQDQLRQQEKQLKQTESDLNKKNQSMEDRKKELSAVLTQQKNQLLKITGMSNEQAKELLLNRLENDVEHDMSKLIERKVEAAKESAEEQSREIINIAIQRYAAEQTCEMTVSMVDIPSDDMKGRVIGREGRNIRAFEKATGVDVIIDDTPGVIIVSGFDPLRREIARQSMSKLIQDGRIHPTRIEEIVVQMKKEVNDKVLQIGKAAATEVDVRGLNNKILTMIGSLHYRTSFGQNVLRHSVEVAFLAQVMADELGLDGSIARRAGFLHDIGKAMDRETEGGHPAIGANFLKRFGESDIVLNAVESHHGDIEANNHYTPLVAAADAISASRPGARRETLERYIKRLEKLEEIANGFEGVTGCYAIQAGREVRVIVDADKVNDDATTLVAREIAKKIEDEMTYPGEIKVTLLREVRCVEYAR
jgi:ribonuclease Y